MLENVAWELRWPPALLQSEGSWLLRDAAGRLADWSSRVEQLLEEAFVGSEVSEAFGRCSSNHYSDPFSDDPEDLDQRSFLRELVDYAERFRRVAAPTPYWPQRQQVSRPPARLTPEEVRRRFVRLVDELLEEGYLDQAFPNVCVDSNDNVWTDPSDVLQDRLGVGGLWPFRNSETHWADDTFYGLIEVLHDLVARPRSRTWHDWNGCGWHWNDYAPSPGRALYRWRINQLLDRSVIDLRLADSGEDVGRLVAVTDDARADLAARATKRSDPTGDRVRHALALHRARGATEHDKRSAILVLAGVLEERRGLLKAALLRKDEGALFQIANEFALRHQDRSQKPDYDVAFLDWVFWWFLATIDLTDQILVRQAAAAS